MKALLLSVLITVLLFVGCVPVDSLNPIYTDKNVIVDQELIGKWFGDNPDEGSLRIDRAGDNAYQLVVTDRRDNSPPHETVFDAHLVSLGGERYFDVVPRQLETLDDSVNVNSLPIKNGLKFEPSLVDIGGGLFLEFSGTVVPKGKGQKIQVKLRPAHWIFKVELDHGVLRLAYLDDEWIKNEAKRGTLAVRHQKAKGEFLEKLVLTGSTVEMQQFVVEQADREGAFDEVGPSLHKQKAPVSENQSSQN